ncbi:MAG: chemotaxis protein CheC [Candidatus Hydrothermarchaeales archaeon]
MEVVKLSEAQLDALREVGNIGAGHASTALAQMIGKKVYVKVPLTALVEVEKIPEVVGGMETLIVGIYLRLLGDIRGTALLTFKKDQALYLANLMLGKEDDPLDVMNEENKSAIMELGNILSGSYMTALSAFMGLNIVPSVPYMAYDMVGAVLDLLLIDLSQTVEHALIIETEFATPQEILGGEFLMFFEPNSYMKILKALGMYEEPAVSK